MIGLVDYDFQSAPLNHLPPPNIEIMKLATYYKTEENLFCRIIGLEESELSSYDKIYFFSESNTPITIPAQFKKANNVFYGGTAFTGNYQPFNNEIIDYTIPRVDIYKGILKHLYQEGVSEKVIAHILDDGYYRNYAGNNKLPLPPVLSNKRFFLYDKDFFYPDWEETIARIEDKKISSIVRIHPIVCKKVSAYFALRSHAKIARSNDIIIDLDIPLSEFYYFLKRYKKKFLADITFNSNVFITLGGNFQYNKQYYDDFDYKMNLLYSFWCNEIPIKIKYIYPQLGYVNPIEHLSLLIERWAGTKSKITRTIEDRLPKNKQLIENIEYETVLKNCKDSLKLFRQNYEKLLKMRSWINYGY